MDDNIEENIEEHNRNKKSKILIVFDDMIANMFSSKKTLSKIIGLFIRDRKLNISVVLITQYYFSVPKMLEPTYYIIMKIPNKQELQ